MKETANNEDNERENIPLASRSRGKEFRSFHGGRYNRNRWRNDGQRQFNERSNIRKVLQCYHCRRYGHTKADCWYKHQQMNSAAKNEEEEKFFMTCTGINVKKCDLWFVDSGCSNHMTGTNPYSKSLIRRKESRCNLKIQKRCKLRKKAQ